MSMNFYFDMCSLIVTLTLISAAFFKRTIYGRTNRIFLAMLFTILGASFFKVGYQIILAGSSFSQSARNIAYIFIYCHLIVQNYVMPFACFYIFSTVGITNIVKNKKSYKIPLIVMEFIPLVLIISNIFTKKFFFISGAMDYFENPQMHLIYLCYIVVLIWGTGIMVLYRKAISKVKLVLGMILLSFNVLSFLLQIFIPEVRIGLFIMTMSAYLVLIFAQRPELLVHGVTGARSEHSFWQEIDRSLKLNLKPNVIFFKIINHKNIALYLGQEKYNAFLRAVSDRIHRIVEHSQFASKMEIYYLGDSIFAVSTDFDSKPKLQFVAESITRSFSGKLQFEDFEFFPEISSCIVNLPADIDNIEYIKYFSKEYHRIIGETSEVVWIREVASTKEFKMKNEIDKILNDALDYGNFEVFYQPIWGVKEQKYVSAEALIRLNDPVYGYVPPSIFIPMAESNGLIHKIGDFVFEEVCSFIASEDFKRLGLEYIEVNLSTAQCVESNLVDKIIESLNVWGVSPEQIRLEITENSADFNPAMVEQNISELHNIGIRFALDDYGTGYSNIKKVTNLPLDVVKLDKAFVDEMENPVMWTVIQDTIHMLRKLNKEVMVEGVEDKATSDCFSNLKTDGQPSCKYLQGYHYSKPLPKKDFIELLNKAK